MFSMLRKSILSRLWIYLGLLSLSQFVFSAGQDIVISDSNNLNLYSTASARAPRSFCGVVGCNPDKSLLLPSGSHTARRGSSGEIEILYKSYSAAGERGGNITFSPAPGVSRDMRINFRRLGIVLVPSAILSNLQWDVFRSELRRAIADDCQGITHADININGEQGYALMFKERSSCLMQIKYNFGGLQIKHVVVEYDFNAIGMLPAGNYVGRLEVGADNVRGLRANRTEALSSVSDTFSVGLTVHPNISVDVPDSNVVLQKNADGSLSKEVRFFIDTNSRFSIQYVGRHSLTNNVNTHSVDCEVRLPLANFSNNSNGWTRRDALDVRRVEEKLKFYISGNIARTMLPGEYRGNVTLRFNAVL